MEGCDLEHWRVLIEKPEAHLTTDEIVDRCIKILAQVVGSEEEAKMKIYSIATRAFCEFGAHLLEELCHKLEELPEVIWVFPDSHPEYKVNPYKSGHAMVFNPYSDESVIIDPEPYEIIPSNFAKCGRLPLGAHGVPSD